MDWSLLVGFAAMAAVIEISPGPNFLLITRTVPAFGLPGTLATVSGFGCSYMMHGALAIFGVSAILAATPMLLVIIQLVGACYLLYLGVTSFSPRSAKAPVVSVMAKGVDILLLPSADRLVVQSTTALVQNKQLCVLSNETACFNAGIDIVLDTERGQTSNHDLYICFRDGTLISALNPKITLFYMAAFPQFVLSDNDTAMSSFSLVFVHILICALWAIAVAAVLEYTLNKTGSKNLVNRINSISGFALIGLSVAFFSSAAQAF